MLKLSFWCTYKPAVNEKGGEQREEQLTIPKRCFVKPSEAMTVSLVCAGLNANAILCRNEHQSILNTVSAVPPVPPQHKHIHLVPGNDQTGGDTP